MIKAVPPADFFQETNLPHVQGKNLFWEEIKRCTANSVSILYVKSVNLNEIIFSNSLYFLTSLNENI